MAKKDAPYDRLIRHRIRNRRESRGMAAYELAERARISPSYLSLIESGAKLPSEEIAVRIAEALDDEVDLYRAWVHAGRYPDFENHLKRLLRLERVGSTPELRARVRSGERIGDGEGHRENRRESRPVRARRGSASERANRWLLSAGHIKDSGADEEEVAQSMDFMAMEEEPATPAAGLTRPVPVLADGEDPRDDADDADNIVDWLEIDARLLPPGTKEPFAYRPGEAAVERVRGLIRPGDLVVLTAHPRSVDSSSIYAVRHEGRVVLTRVVRHGPVLLLMPSDDGGGAGADREPGRAAVIRAVGRGGGHDDPVVGESRGGGGGSVPAPAAGMVGPVGRGFSCSGLSLERAVRMAADTAAGGSGVPRIAPGDEDSVSVDQG